MKKILLLLFIVTQSAISQTVYIADMPTGGTLTLGTNFLFNINQTTAGQTITVPSFIGGGKSPIIISNIGSAPFTLSPGGVVPAGNGFQLTWGGSSWSITSKGYAGPYINSILTQSITSGDTAHAPSGNVIYNALALKQLINLQCNISGTSINWNCSHSYKTLTGNVTLTFANASDAKTIVVEIINSSGNSYTITWPTVYWGGSGTPPVQRPGTAGTSNDADIYTFTQLNGIIYGTVRQ